MSVPELWVDASAWQSAPDWAQVKADGVDGAIVRCNEGNVEDARFVANWSAVAAAGLRRGAYDFAFTSNSPSFEAGQFLAFIKAAGGWKPDDVLVIDAEQNVGNLTGAEYATWVLSWCQIVHQQTGITPWVYSFDNWIATYLQDAALAAYPLWYAWPNPGGPPPAPAPWKSYVAWQFTTTSIAGVSGVIDEDRVYLPDPPEGDTVYAIFIANLVKNSDGSTPAPGTQAEFLTDFLHCRWLHDPTDALAVDAAVHPANIGVPAELSIVGAPVDQVTATMLGLAFGPAPASALTPAQASQLADVQSHVDKDLA